jgi:hypothetical protein
VLEEQSRHVLTHERIHLALGGDVLQLGRIELARRAGREVATGLEDPQGLLRDRRRILEEIQHVQSNHTAEARVGERK